VNPSVIEQDDAWHGMWTGRYLINKSDGIVACGRSLLRTPNQLAAVAQCPEYVDALPMRQRFD